MNKDFDKQFRLAKRLWIAWSVFVVCVGVSMLAFFVWVVLRIMAYFGV